MKTETLFLKKCTCGNVCRVTGYVSIAERVTEINTYDAELNPTCGLHGNRGVTCICGKEYRMIDRRAWHALMMKENETQP